MKKLFLLILVLLSVGKSFAQITVAGSQTASVLAQSLVGAGVTFSNPTLNCPSVANGTFVVTPPNVTNLGIQSGIVLTSGTAQTAGATQGANGPASGPSTSNNTSGDPDLNILINGTTYDGCVLEFDFVPLGDSVKFDYVFGSSEYPSFTCTSFNDVFGFFISGPGITGPYSNNSQNIALVPGSTTCPVGVSTIYCPNSPGCCNTTQYCFGNTPGCSMFTALNNTCNYFVCNAGGTSVNYQGFTVPLTALAVVQPCSTYHLKLAIADKSDHVLDSGVFLKEGSLTSNSITFSPISNLLAPYPYIVEGCAPGYVKVKRPVASPFPYTINYQLGGSASYPADYTVSTIPLASPFGSVTIPANDTVAYISFAALQDGIPEPLEEIKIYQLAPCTNAIVDSTSLFISDTIQMNIITPDTTICAEDSVHILVSGSDSLLYSWTPTTNINNPNIKEPTVSPNFTGYVKVCASLPNSGCAAKCDSILITINQPPTVGLGNDTTICKNMSVQFNPTISPAQNYTYTWTGNGANFLSATNILNPIGTFTITGNYTLYLHVDPVALGCQGNDTINIQVLPNDIILYNGDTVVCKGATVPIQVDGHPLFSYSWSPTTYLNNPFIEDPISNPDSAIHYTVTATYPGCIPMVKDFNIDVQPVPTISAGADRSMCDFDTIQLHSTVSPSWYNQYIYNWTPAANLSNNTISDPYFDGHTDEMLQLIVSTPIGCADTDFVFMTVYSTEFANVTPSAKTLCPNETVQLVAGGGQTYYWTPPYGLSDTTINNPIASPIATTEYTLYSTSLQGCVDTDIVRVEVAPQAILNAGDDVTIYPGESTQLYADGNCSFFNWFPNYQINSTTIKNPTVNPLVTTQYFINGKTEFGCEVTDSITVKVSPESIIDLPNAFSPGAGTSINDNLKIITRGIVHLNSFKIFNRWGELIFDTSDLNKGWDGKFKGISQPMGSYVYMIDATTDSGKRFYKQGNITLIR